MKSSDELKRRAETLRDQAKRLSRQADQLDIRANAPNMSRYFH